MSDLIDIETQFRVMNMELESKTKELLKKADDVVRSQEEAMYEQLMITGKKSPRPVHIEPHINILRYTWQSDDSDNYFSNTFPTKDDTISDLLTIKERIKSDMNTNTNNDNENERQVSPQSESLPNINEIKSKESLDSYPESVVSKSEEDNHIDHMMRNFNGQKDFNKTLDEMLKIKKRTNYTKTSYLENSSFKSRVNFDDTGSLNDVSAQFKTKSNHGDAAIIKCLKKRLSNLEEEIHKSQESLRKKTTEIDTLSKSNQALEENKVRITGQVNSLKTQIVRMESKIATLTSKLQLKESECRGLRSEKESLIRTAKEAAQGSSGSEIRLARSREEIQSLRSSLNTTKAQEREVRESAKHQVDELKHALGRSEKREREAISTVRKQALLIDNLKRQVNLLEVKHHVTSIDKQLDDVVKWRHKKL